MAISRGVVYRICILSESGYLQTSRYELGYPAGQGMGNAVLQST